MAVVNHYNLRRVLDIYGNVQDRDLGAVARQIDKIVDANQEVAAARQLHPRPRPDRDHAHLLPRPALRPRLRHRARLPADRRKLPVLARSLHHHHGAARRARRHRALPLPHAHDAQRPGADGRHHVHGRRHGKQHPRRLLRQGAPRSITATPSPPRSKPAPPASAPSS